MDKAKFEAEQKRLFAVWGLQLWHFKYCTRKRALGVCRYRTRTIEVGLFHVENDSEEHVLDTLKHEIAHAKAGPDVPHHGDVWKQWARKVGCSEWGCEAQASAALELAVQPGRYQAYCDICKVVHHRHRKRKHTTAVCLKCNTRIAFIEVPPTPPKPVPKRRFFD